MTCLAPILPEPLLTCYDVNPREHTSMKFEANKLLFSFKNITWQCCPHNVSHFVPSAIPWSILWCRQFHDYCGVIVSAMASQITSLTIVYSTVYSGADQRNHQSPASLAFLREIHSWPVNSPHKWPVTRKMFPFDDVIMMIQVVVSIPRFTYVYMHHHLYQVIFICISNSQSPWVGLLKLCLNTSSLATFLI